jgi:hypothetical protein
LQYAIHHPAQPKPRDYNEFKSRQMASDRLADLRREKSIPGLALGQKERARLRLEEAIGVGLLWQVEARYREGNKNEEVVATRSGVRKRTCRQIQQLGVG